MDKKIYQIAKEKSFADGLRKYVKRPREIYCAVDLQKCKLDPEDPEKSIRYYYQVRSNVVHRGKSVVKDFDTIKSSLEEFLAIFKDVLYEAFKKTDD